MNNNEWYSDRGMPHMISARDSFVANSEHKSNSKHYKNPETFFNGYVIGLMVGLFVGIINGVILFG